MYTDAEVETASRNYEAQIRLIEDLREFRVIRGISVQMVADDLGTSVAEVEAFEAAEVAATLTEIRYYANAVGVVIDYRVKPA